MSSQIVIVFHKELEDPTCWILQFHWGAYFQAVPNKDEIWNGHGYLLYQWLQEMLSRDLSDHTSGTLAISYLGYLVSIGSLDFRETDDVHIQECHVVDGVVQDCKMFDDKYFFQVEPRDGKLVVVVPDPPLNRFADENERDLDEYIVNEDYIQKRNKENQLTKEMFAEVFRQVEEAKKKE